MHNALALSRGWAMASTGEALTLPGSISEDVAKQLPRSAEVLMRTTVALLESCILSAIEKRSRTDFKAWREASFVQYFNAVLGLPSLMKFLVPPHVIDRLNREFFCELESDLREKGAPAFGADVRDQAMFTAWTLRKVSDLVSQIPPTPLAFDEQKIPELVKLVGEFTLNAIWTRFHLHCLVTSMRVNRAIYPEPLDEIVTELRAAVNTYALARRALDLLVPLTEPPMENISWDEEDEGLLAEATRELSCESF